MEIKNPTTVHDIAKEFNLNKSTLHYYVTCKLIVPLGIVGKTFVFEKDEIVQRLKKIQRMQKQGMSLKEIYNKIVK